jgi:hypothetical protein
MPFEQKVRSSPADCRRQICNGLNCPCDIFSEIENGIWNFNFRSILSKECICAMTKIPNGMFPTGAIHKYTPYEPKYHPTITVPYMNQFLRSS